MLKRRENVYINYLKKISSMKVVEVSLKNAETVKNRLIELKALDTRFLPFREKEKIYFPILENQKFSDMETKSFQLLEKIDISGLDQQISLHSSAKTNLPNTGHNLFP